MIYIYLAQRTSFRYTSVSSRALNVGVGAIRCFQFLLKRPQLCVHLRSLLILHLVYMFK